jgi:putative transposase
MLHDQLESASPDLLRSLLTTFVETLMLAEADAMCGAPYGTPSPGRVNFRNGYRHRDFDTRVGTLDVAIPKLRSGSYFPDRLLERRHRAEAALTSVVATCYLLGVSTRGMEKLVESLGITRLSRSQVSVMTADLDAQVVDFRTRPLDAGPYTFVATSGGAASERPLMLDTQVIVRRQDQTHSASITSAYHALCGPEGGGDRRSPT